MDSAYFKTRYVPDPGRSRVWRAICEYLQRFVPIDGVVLDVGAGYCDFINQIKAAQKYALDMDPEVANYCAPDVRFLLAQAGSATEIPQHSVDVVLASNLLDHLSDSHRSDLFDRFDAERANMGLLLRWGNWFVAKILEVLFNTNYLSDVGCTYRLIRRQALAKMLPTFRVKSNFFGPEMMVRGYRMGFRCLQIPVNYKERVGKSSVTGDLKKAMTLGIQMLVLIIAMRFGLERWLLRVLK
jgi:hypothetical protein